MHLGIDFLRILVDSGGQVGAMRPPKHPKTPQLGAQDGPEAAQETPKTAQESPKSCLNGLQESAKNLHRGALEPGFAQEPPKRCPRAAQTPSRPRFWTIFLIILDHF